MIEPVAIETSIAASIATVALASPARANAFAPGDLYRLGDALGAAGADEAVRAIVLTGRPGIFSAGAALDALKDSPAGDATAAIVRETRHVVAALIDSPVPVIVAADGAAAGAAAGLALLADALLVSPRARLMFPFARLGLVPDTAITVTLPASIGQRRAAAILFQGGQISGGECVDWGIALALHQSETLMAEAAALAAAWGAAPRGAHRAIRRLLRRGDILDAVTAEATEQGERLAHPDTAAAVRATVQALAAKKPGGG